MYRNEFIITDTSKLKQLVNNNIILLLINAKKVYRFLSYYINFVSIGTQLKPLPVD